VSLPLAVAVGDPAGIGPVVSLRAAARLVGQVPVVLFGDAAQLCELAQREGISAAVVHAPPEAPPGTLGLIDVGRVSRASLSRHAPSAEAGAAQLEALQRAAESVQRGQARALVTGPTSKEAIVSSGHAFVGQTEYLAHLAGLAADAVTMLFLGPTLKVALVTTHLAIAQVPAAITGARVSRSVRHLAEALLRLSGDRPCSLAVAGLNPHAGEGGLFGREEIEVLQPALAELSREPPFGSGRVVLTGPVPAEAIFRAAQRGDVDGVVAMFHDQATIASKLLDWGAAVNTTWGLPFVRTSVDHGVAYDAARAGTADAEGMLAAMQMALRLTGDAHVD
jgi:4-phospho-D-threonate 3-dehydrogenase / 4-phospho-D-erythronate 3-dehydrogenase